MKLVENLILLLGIMAILAWCAGCAFAALRLVQMLGLERDTAGGRTLVMLAAIGGLGFAFWTIHKANQLWSRKCAKTNSNAFKPSKRS